MTPDLTAPHNFRVAQTPLGRSRYFQKPPGRGRHRRAGSTDPWCMLRPASAVEQDSARQESRPVLDSRTSGPCALPQPAFDDGHELWRTIQARTLMPLIDV